MDSTTVKQSRTGLLAGRSPLLRLQSDERLIALIRAGNDGAFEHLFERYRSRLLGFCRHMLGSKEDAEDVLQEVFAASYNAIRADQRDINVRPWLYRIARNRCLNHLRRPTQDARETMDDHVHGHGVTTADLVHRRADFRHLLEDIQKLPETQRTALLLREMDALSYEQIAEAMDNTVPSVKSLLVRARMSLAEAAEAREMSCTDVRLELAEITEGLKKLTPPIRRHLRECNQCRDYRTQLKRTTTAMALALPLGPILILKKLALAKLGAAAAAGSGAVGGAAAGGAGGAAAGGTAAGGLAAAGGGVAGGAGAIGLGAVATKAITVTAATALLAGGAVQVKNIAVPAHEVKRAAPAAQKVSPPPFESGGQSAETLPPIPLVKKELEAAKKEEAAAAGEGATTAATPVDPAATTDAAVATPAGTTGPGATGPQGPAPGAPVGADAVAPPAESGGAALPPPSQAPPATETKPQAKADGAAPVAPPAE